MSSFSVSVTNDETITNIVIPYGERKMIDAFDAALEASVKNLKVIIEDKMKAAVEKWAEENITKEMAKMDMAGLSNLIAVCTARQIAKAVEGKP